MAAQTVFAPINVVSLEADKTAAGRTGEGIASLVALLKHQRWINQLVERPDQADADSAVESEF